MGGSGLEKKYVWEAFPRFAAEASVRFPELSCCWSWDDPSYLADLMHLGLLCTLVRPRRIFEIGTSNGYSSLFLAANSGPDVQIWTMDLPTSDLSTQESITYFDRYIIEACHKAEPLFVSHPLGQTIRRVYGDSAKFDFSPYRSSIDFFFVDGAHTYDYVRLDTISALRCCRAGSVIAWHDCGRHGLSRDVTTWLEELNRFAPVYAAPGSSVAFMPCDFDCEALATRLNAKAA
jgi:predicted O-methyltransferase YrrM